MQCRLAYGPADSTVSCFGKIQIGFTFLCGLTRVVPGKGPLNGGMGCVQCRIGQRRPLCQKTA